MSSPYDANAQGPSGYAVYWNPNQVIYQLETSRSVLFTNLTVKVHMNRVTIEKRPFFGGQEMSKTYSAFDMGEVFVQKNRRRAIVGVHRANSADILFEIPGLTHAEAQGLKNALDEVICYRYVNNSPTMGSVYAA